MKSRAWFAWVLCVLAAAAFAVRAQAQQAEPTVDQIYQAARSGQLSEARGMVDQVVRNHPDSGKAHYVRAEIAARQGDAAVAQQELAQAERLSPGLPFARPEAAQALRAQVQALQARGTTSATRSMGAAPGETFGAPTPAASAELPWGKLLVGAALVVGVMAVLRRRRAAAAGGGMPASPTAGPVVSSGGMPAPGASPGGYPQGPYGAYPPAGGMGSSLGRGLATGLAVGAGAVAAQELGHRILHGRDGPVPADDPMAGGLSGDLSRFDAPNADMGGQDFGIQEAGSWDTGGGFDSGDISSGDWDNS